RQRKPAPQLPFPRKNDIPLKPKPAAKAAKRPSDEMDELVGNYAEIIKKARGDMKIEDFASSLNEKASVLQKVESGKLKPTMKLARRIEKRYRVKLVEHKEEAEDIDDVVWKQEGKKDYSPTLGDFIKKDD
nr:helix-turn-helix domain-containing protein [Candidatus Sigynarchaeota archaeon]